MYPVSAQPPTVATANTSALPIPRWRMSLDASTARIARNQPSVDGTTTYCLQKLTTSPEAIVPETPGVIQS